MLASEIKQEKEIKNTQIGKEKMKVFFFQMTCRQKSSNNQQEQQPKTTPETNK